MVTLSGSRMEFGVVRCIGIPWVEPAFTEAGRTIVLGHGFIVNGHQYLTKESLVDHNIRVVSVELLYLLLVKDLNWSKNTNVQRLQYMGGVWQ